MPVAEVVTAPSQAVVTVKSARGRTASAGVPTWQPGHAMMPPRAACPSQQGHGSPSMCAGFAEATTTAGKATHSTAATRASVDRIRVARVITVHKDMRVAKRCQASCAPCAATTALPEQVLA